MPKALTRRVLVLTATICFETQFLPRCCCSHLRTVRALSIVSAVVNVFDTITTSVSSGLRPCSERATSMGSTFARKRSCRSSACLDASGSVLSAVWTNSGPRKEPPMPIATTDVSGLPVTPVHWPLRTLSLKSLILSSTFQTSGTTFLPSTIMFWSRRARVATCSTARSSVLLMCSPLNIALIFSFSFAALARSFSSLMVLALTRCLDRSR
mmetsp:Transcript_22982/g.68335  ORF Transcript_22982/g.68335 Transcript_22982/m.68335 type:complete len:211 (+) Transcript_22982:2434-3066(+)